ncbi:rRNA methyltransferase 2, mitochondrial isoform X2 [Copidosoma floridanum]|nr:rRNA methyltransferase 2, mitochondrial isoform X2 [Copidosoma floridanum]
MMVRKIHTFQTLLKETPKNLKGKKLSSQNWIVRQLKDPYVEKAKQYSYRCRSAFKLLELNERHKIFTPGLNVVDCGAAPGSWTQVAVRLTNADGKMMDKQLGKVVAIDKLPIHPIEGAITLGSMDFTSDLAQENLKAALEGKFADLVMSDMAPNSVGMRQLDHEKIIKLAYSALKFAITVSRNGATFIVKVWDGNMANELEANIKKYYRNVKIARPDATRDESSEKFILAQGFKGIKAHS